MRISLLRADYRNPVHGAAIVALLDAYARDPMGGGEPLPQATRDGLMAALSTFPTAFSVLAMADEQPAGLANCFDGFSTFACKPLVNIHDVVVAPRFRGQGIARRLFTEIEVIARAKGCCKMTLEVLSGNTPALGLYRSLGFGDYVLDPEQGKAVFWQKSL
jgi:ribosomal protein S18 acetylase RimI-like enzyme